MRALELRGDKGIDSIVYTTERPIPMPENDEILVQVKAVGLNPVDYQIAEGFGDVNLDEPVVLGLDVAGIVKDIGASVKEFKPGDRVFYHGNLEKANGGFAEYACTTSHTASKLPESINFVQAAAIPCSGFTAYQAVIRKLKPEVGDTILIHGGAGGVGGYAVQLAKLRGMYVYTSCSEYNFEYVRSLGADEAIDYNKVDVHEEIMRRTNGRGVDCVVNTLNTWTATRDLGILAFGGQLVAIEGLPRFEEFTFFEKAISIHEVALGAAHINGDLKSQKFLAQMGDAYISMLQQGEIQLPQIQTVRLEEIPSFLRRMKTRHGTGKTVAVP